MTAQRGKKGYPSISNYSHAIQALHLLIWHTDLHHLIANLWLHFTVPLTVSPCIILSREGQTMVHGVLVCLCACLASLSWNNANCDCPCQESSVAQGARIQITNRFRHVRLLTLSIPTFSCHKQQNIPHNFYPLRIFRLLLLAVINIVPAKLTRPVPAFPFVTRAPSVIPHST